MVDVHPITTVRLALDMAFQHSKATTTELLGTLLKLSSLYLLLAGFQTLWLGISVQR
jgi:hypothetical protein